MIQQKPVNIRHRGVLIPWGSVELLEKSKEASPGSLAGLKHHMLSFVSTETGLNNAVEENTKHYKPLLVSPKIWF